MFVDTSFVIDLMRERRRGRIGDATRTLHAHSAVKLRMPVFVRCELEAGARRSGVAEARDALRPLQLYSVPLLRVR